jgi:LacI family transcriptional regulator
MGNLNKKTSIKDIAIEAGVAISTVSFVINGKDVVAEKTKKKVLKAIKKLDYRTNIIARSLRTKSTKAIGVIVPDIATPYTSQIVKGMEDFSRKMGYTLILGCSYYSKEEEEKQVNIFIDKLIDGIIFFSGYDNYDFVKKISMTGIPMVAVDRDFENNEFYSVTIDNEAGTKKAVDYLYKKGHRHIGYVTFSSQEQTVVKKRLKGYMKGLQQNDLPYRKDYILEDDGTRLDEIEYTYKIFKDYLRKNKNVTAILTLSDYHAFGAMKAIKEMGLKIPQDISIVGYDNILFSNFVDPPLTTIKQPKKILGKTGTELLFKLIEGKKVENKHIILETELIERDSVAPPREKALLA